MSGADASPFEDVPRTAAPADAAAASDRVHAAPAGSILDAFAVGVLLVSPRGDVVEMNRAARDLLHVEPVLPQAIGPPLLERLGARWARGEAIAFEETPFARARRGEVVREAVVSLEPPGQGRRWVEIGAAPVGARGRVDLVVVNVVDRTRGREAEEEREALVAHLVSEVAPTLDRIADRARLLRDGPCAGPARELARAAGRLGATVRELETALRFDAGRILPRPELVDAKAFLLDLLERWTPALEAARVVASARSGLPSARVDPDHLERILVELIRGALAGAPPESAVLVDVDLADGRVALTIASSGQDVPPQDLPRVFDRFYRSRGRPAGRLHVVRGLVEANRGRVWAESGAGRGLAIHVSLPAAPG